MENIIRIPTAKQARELVAQNASLKVDKIWGDVLHAIENTLASAIADCQTSVYISESVMRGVSTKAVYYRLKPYLEGMGYHVSMGKYAGITISWEEESNGPF